MSTQTPVERFEEAAKELKATRTVGQVDDWNQKWKESRSELHLDVFLRLARAAIADLTARLVTERRAGQEDVAKVLEVAELEQQTIDFTDLVRSHFHLDAEGKA